MDKLISFFLTVLLLAGGMSAGIGTRLNDRLDKAPIDPSKGKILGGASRYFEMRDGTAVVAFGRSDGIGVRTSADGGVTWQNEQTAVPNDGRALANYWFCEFEDGLYLAYRAIGDTPEGYYTSLRVHVSEDGGKSWRFHSVITENLEPEHNFNGVWEPCLGEMNGKLVCLYANDSTAVTGRQNIESLTWDGSRWTDRRIVSDGEKHDSRDGMPVWTALSGGGYACVIESTRYRDEGYPFVIQLLYSADGTRWSEPRDVYVPATKGSKAAAPGVAELPDGRLAVTFQTDEDKEEKGDGVSVSKLICTVRRVPACLLGRGSFTTPKKLFPDEYDGCSLWGAVCCCHGALYYGAATALGEAIVKVPI